MDNLPKNIYIKYNPDTIASVRKMFNLDKPGQIDEAVDLLDAWVKKQRHFVRKDYSREYLERLIILLKGSVERAKLQLENICTLRTLLPHFFEEFNAKTNNMTWRDCSLNLSHNKKLGNLRQYMLHAYYHSILLAEYAKAYDYVVCYTFVLDLRDVNIADLIPGVHLLELKQYCTIVFEGYAVRVTNIIFITSSKAIDLVVKMLKQIVSEKIARRILVLKNVEDLQQHIPKEVLPSDYGGDLEETMHALHGAFIEELSSENNIKYFKEMSRCKVVESLRISSKCYNEQFSDLAGTFRSLNVD